MRWSITLCVVFAGTLAWRTAVLQRLGAGPLLDYLAADSASYWRWATEIRTGAAGHNPWFLGPLYAYTLAGMRLLLGDDVHRILFAQAFLGACTVTILTDVVRRLTSPAWALAAAVVLGGCGVLVFFDAQILMEGLLLALESAFLWCVVRMKPHARVEPLVLAAALCIGTLALGRPTEMLLLVVLLERVWHVMEPARRIRAALQVLGIVALAGVPGAWHHWRTEHVFVPFTYSLGFNFYMGNGPEATGTFVPIAGPYGERSLGRDLGEGGIDGDGRSFLLDAHGLRLSAEESSRYWLRAGLRDVVGRPGRWLKLLGRKLAMSVNRRELPQVASLEAYEVSGGPLGWPGPFVWVLLGGFGLATLPWAWRGSVRPAVLMLIVSWAGIATFFVVDRYRVHLLVPLVPLAAWGAHSAWTAVRERRTTMTTAWVLSCAGAVLLVLAPVIPRSRAHERWSAAQMIGAAWLSRGQPEQALPYFQEAAAIDTRGQLPQSDTPAAMALRAIGYTQLGVTLQALGRYDEALSELQKAVELAPRTPDVWVLLGDVAAAAGQTQRSSQAYAAAGMSSPDAARRLVGLAQSENRRGRPGVTVALLHAACELDPGYEMAVIPYVRMQIEAGAYGEAIVWLEKARAAGLDENVYRAHAAWIAQQQGRNEDVATLLDGIPKQVQRSDPRVAGTLELMGLKSSK